MRNQFPTIHIRPLVPTALLLLLLFSHGVYPADISRDVREGREDESLEHGGYFEFSLSSILNQMPIPGSDELIGTIGIGGHYRYKRFFIDAHAESYNQFQLGLNAYSGDVWSVDFLTASSEHGVDSELNFELKLFTERESATYLGVRATGYNGPYLLQFETLWDIFETGISMRFWVRVSKPNARWIISSVLMLMRPPLPILSTRQIQALPL